MTHQGSCHCGRIAYEVEGQPDQLTTCNCSHCARKGYLMWFVPRETVSLKTPESDMATYTFNKHAIQHHFCPTCGCAPFGFGEHEGKQIAAINVRCLPDMETADMPVREVDGRSL
ncbi:MAG: GFA family protein [Rhodanobacteraceae bacterium]